MMKQANRKKARRRGNTAQAEDSPELLLSMGEYNKKYVAKYDIKQVNEIMKELYGGLESDGK